MKKIINFLLGASLALTACQQPQFDQQLFDNFQNPPQEARPRVWWHWMNGNITKDGIYKDIMWMNRAGIGGFHNFDAGLATAQVVDQRLIYMTPEWKDAFKYAITLADSLGMEATVASAPGWSNTGGPWVKPENAMKKLTWREMDVKGGLQVDIELPAPYETTGNFLNYAEATSATSAFSVDVAIPSWYKDLYVIAVKKSADDKTMAELGAKVTSSGGRFTLEQLTDGDLSIAMPLPGDLKQGYAWIQYEFPQATTIKALSVTDGNVRSEWQTNKASVTKHLQVSDDGKAFRTVCDIPTGGSARQTIDIPATTAKYFRVTFDNNQSTSPYAALASILGYDMGAASVPATPVRELVLYTVNKVNHAEEKAGFSTPFDLADFETPASEGAQEVIDLTDKVQNGHLTWDAPAGDWRIYRFGYSLTGKTNHPASPEATGLEVTKLDKDAVTDYITYYLNTYKDATDGLIGKKGIQNLLIDSYEAGWETWAPKMPQEFEQRRGYSLLKWMPALTGQIVESSEKTEQFLFDWRTTIGELIAENMYGNIANVAKEWGMDTYFEAHENGRLYLVDGMAAKSKADIPMAAIWQLVPGVPVSNSTYPMAASDIRESASVAHVYGRKFVAAESLTANGMDGGAYSYYPGNLKSTADLELANGVNRFVIHESAHQPVDDKKPGLGLMIFGQWFNRHETWAEQAKAWTDYLARSSYMLQQGQFVADVAYFYGEDNVVTGLFGNEHPAVPAGYNFDYVNAEILTTMLNYNGRELTVPSGMHYQMLVLDPNCQRMSLPVLRKVAELAKAGALICGEKPTMEPTMQGDKEEFQRLVDEVWNAGLTNVISGVSIAEALQQAGIQPDFSASDMTDLRYVHRTTDKAEIYWVNNRTDKARTIETTFRTSGLKPTLWHPETGQMEEVSYTMNKGFTTVQLPLVQQDAVFVVFSGAGENKHVVPTVQETQLAEINTPWTVAFDADWGAPAQVTFDKLMSYTESEDPGIKYYSGTAVYTNKVTVNEADLQSGSILIDLGKVGCLAEVKVNGQSAGVLWKAPYRADITSLLKAGENTLEIAVVNQWVNRLIGDAQPDAQQKYTYTSFTFYYPGSQLLPAGLMGPVRLVTK
ncbi:MAG: glycosyl hydrolase [Bacteroidales bacterium]|nr:glycosyl hydrolase [Bacteroidales bacterium]